MSDKKSPLAERVSIFLQALQVLALISGGVWFLLEYSWNIKNAQREESLKYAAKAYEANMTSDLALMGRPFQDTSFAPKMRAVLKESYKGKDICPVEEFYRTQILPLYYTDDDNKQQFFDSLNSLSVFYTSASVCVNSDTCDLETACNFFFYDAKSLLSRHCTYFDKVSINYGYSPVQDIR